MNPTEIFALAGSPARIFGRLLMFTEYLSMLPRPTYGPAEEYGRARYGPYYRLKPWLFFDTDGLQKTEEIVNYGTDEEVQQLRRSHTDSFNMVAVVGALLAQIPLATFSLPDLDQTHYFARGGFVLAMVTSLLAVFFTCLQQRALGFLQRPVDIRAWLSNGVRYTNHKGDVVFQSSYISHQFLQAPYELLSMSITLFLMAFGIYLGSAFTRHVPLNVDGNGESTGNLGVLIAFLVCTTFALTMMGQLLGGKTRERQRLQDEMALHAFGSACSEEKRSHQSSVSLAENISEMATSTNKGIGASSPGEIGGRPSREGPSQVSLGPAADQHV